MSIPSSDFILRGRVRGFPHNREDFLKIFIDRWDGFIDDFERNTYARHIILQPHQDLSDILDERMLSEGVGSIGEKSSWKVFAHEKADSLKGEHIVIPSGYDEVGECAFN